jgi:hypothetical protein
MRIVTAQEGRSPDGCIHARSGRHAREDERTGQSSDNLVRGISCSADENPPVCRP